MRTTISESLSPHLFLRAAQYLTVVHHADTFLSGMGYASHQRHLVGVDQLAELVVRDEEVPANLRPDFLIPAELAHRSRYTGKGKDTVSQIKNFAFEAETPALGFFSYELGYRLRDVERRIPRAGHMGVPLVHLKRYRFVFEYDTSTHQLWVHTQRNTHRNLSLATELFTKAMETPVSMQKNTISTSPVTTSMSEADYQQGVERVLEHIRDGYTYQLNLSMRFTQRVRHWSPEVFYRLFKGYPAPHYAWFTSAPFTVLSTSPESFLRVRDGVVTTQPIKGTRKFASDEYFKVERFKEGLLQDPKEDAELSMIVDLVRNDISTHCDYGTVAVEQHKEIMTVDNLLQMYSTVRGQLHPDSDCMDLFLDAFPGGSITGCPKRSSMNIIRSLEPHERDVYCGSMVVIEGERTMDSSIAIRTGVHDARSSEFHFYAGSGIVVDSVPERELQETLAKAGKFFKAFKRSK